LKSVIAKLPAHLLVSTLLILSLFSCKKDPYEIGIDLLPPSDTLNVNSTDTCTVTAYSTKQDSIRTDEMTTLLLGGIMDPVFGATTAGFYSQIRLSAEGVNFGENPILDSVVLVLFYSSCYGDTNTLQNVKVYEISEPIEIDSIYYSTHTAAVYPTLLADQDFLPRPHDSVKVHGVKLGPHLRVNLNKYTNYFGNKILEAPTSVLADNAKFIDYLRGLYVEAAPVNYNGALTQFTIEGGVSKVIVYFHDGTDPENDSLSYLLPINEYCARFNNISHNGYLDACQDLKRQILNKDTAQGAQKLFLQGLGGVKIKLRFPFMKNFGKDDVIAVNDALLLLSNIDIDTTLSPPLQLSMIRQDSAGNIGFLVDENEGSSYFGGTYNATTKTYFFRLTRHVQRLIDHYYNTNFDLYLLVNDPRQNVLFPNRITLNGTNPSIPGGLESRLKLKLNYTRLR